MVTVGYSRLQQITVWLQWVTAGYSKLPSGYSELQQVTEWLQRVKARYRVVTVGYIGLQQVTEWLQWVTEVTAGFRVTVNYSE